MFLSAEDQRQPNGDKELSFGGESTFRLWNERKELLNIKRLSNSQFAERVYHKTIYSRVI